jgi:hypothetical protein
MGCKFGRRWACHRRRRLRPSSPHLYRPRSSASGGSSSAPAAQPRVARKSSSKSSVCRGEQLPCIRGHLFRLCPSVRVCLRNCCTCAQDTRSSSASVGRAAAFAAFGLSTLSDADRPDVSHLLQTRNVHPARFCLCPGSLHRVQCSHLLSPVRCD